MGGIVRSTQHPPPPGHDSDPRLGRSLLAALAIATGLTFGLGLLAGPGDAAVDGAASEGTPTPAPVPCELIGNAFDNPPINASRTFGQELHLDQLGECGGTLQLGRQYRLTGTYAVTSVAGSSGGAVRIQVTSPNPGSPGFEFQHQVFGPVAPWPGHQFTPFETPWFTLNSFDQSLTFIFSTTSDLLVPYTDQGDSELWRWNGSIWEPYATGTVINNLVIESTDGSNCSANLPVVLTGTITGAQLAEFTNELFAIFEEYLPALKLYFLERGSPPPGQSWTASGGGPGVIEFYDQDLFESAGLPYGKIGSLRAECTQGGGQEASIASPPSPRGIFLQNIISARLADGREFGQIVPSFTDADAVRAGSSALFHTTHDGGRFRINAGVMATEDGTVLTWTPVGPVGTSLAQGRTLALARGQSTQLNDVAGTFGLGNRSDFMLQMSVASGAALGYVSVLDGKGAYTGTSDPTTVLPVRPASRVTLLEVGAVTGVNQFSGSAVIANHSARAAQVRADFYARGSVGVTTSGSFTLGPGEVRGHEDAVGDLVGQRNVVGTLVLTATNGTLISAIGREFAVYTDSQGAVTGTAGQLMPGLGDDDVLVAGRSYDVIAAIERETATGPERSHLGAFNPGGSDVTLTVTMFSVDNVAEGSLTRTVRPGELLRVNNVVSAIHPAQDGEIKRLRITVSGPLHVLAYRVNATGDPVTLRPIEL